MYIRLILFRVGPRMRSTINELVDQFDPVLKARKGFKSATYFGNDTVGEYGAFVLWETKEDAEAASEAVFPVFEKAVSDVVKEPPNRSLYEVIEAKG